MNIGVFFNIAAIIVQKLSSALTQLPVLLSLLVTKNSLKKII